MKNLYILLLAALSINAFSQSSNNGLVAWYPFNGNANDSSGNGNNGIVYGASLTTDRCGNPNSAYYFNGINSYISLGNNPIIKRVITSFSISMWLNVSSPSTNNGYIIISNVNSNNNGSCMSLDGDLSTTPMQFGFLYYSSPSSEFSLMASQQLKLNNWYFVTVTYNYTGSGINECSVYYNGKFDTEKTCPNITDPGTAPTYLGFEPDENAPQGYHFNGILDDVRIYNRVLDSTEILRAPLKTQMLI